MTTTAIVNKVWNFCHTLPPVFPAQPKCALLSEQGGITDELSFEIASHSSR